MSTTPRYSAATIARALGQNYAPTPEQTAVIEAPLTPQLVVAGAGSGKTETMAARVVYLVANNLVEPEEILGLTFTRKAAGELNDRIAARLRTLAASGLWTPTHLEPAGQSSGIALAQGETAGFTLTADRLPTVSTYHSYAGSIVKDHGLRLGVEPDARLLSQAASWQYAHQIIAGWDDDSVAIDSATATVTSGLMGLAGELAEHLRTPDELRAFYDDLDEALDAIPYGGRMRSLGDGGKALRAAALKHRALLPLVEQYQRMKTENSSLDFSDQVAFAARLALDFPQVGRDARQRYRMVLLDEFQDTSEAQIAFLAALFAAGENRPGVTAVGDPHQSIFAWRGASASTLTKFSKVFALPGSPRTDVLSLSTSWRNEAAILDAANVIADPLTQASQVPVERLHARPGAGSGRVDVARLLTEQDEASYIANWVAQARAERPDVRAAVLCRKRSQFAGVLEAFDRLGIPAEAVGLGGLLQTPEVVDLVSLLWVVDDPTRGDKFMRLLTRGSLRLGAADLEGLSVWAKELHEKLRKEAEAYLAEHGLSADESVTSARAAQDLASGTKDEVSLVEAIAQLPDTSWRGRDGQRISAEALHRLAAFNVALARLRAVSGLPLADFVTEAERVLGLDIEVLARPGLDPSAARAHLDAFADVAGTFSAQAERPTLGGFLDWLAAAEREERGLELPMIEVNDHAVQVLTVHAAKGLEWDIVAVPGLNQGVFPSVAGSTKAIDGQWQFSQSKTEDWMSGFSSIPYPLRGDHEDLPVLTVAGCEDSVELKTRYENFLKAGKIKALADERRLAYVALTRAKEAMLLTAPVWTQGATAPRTTSEYLDELRAAAQAGQIALNQLEWAPLPEADEKPVNPLDAETLSAIWPHDPMARSRELLGDGPTLVAAARGNVSAAPTANVLPLPGTREDRDQEVQLLLAERNRLREQHTNRIVVPAHLSTSALVSLHENPDDFAISLRRPMPRQPAVAARRGTAFHAWVEQHYSSAALVDVDELPGFEDDSAPDDTELEQLQSNFLASEWADRTPIAVEVNLETVIAGFAIRGRVDAVFAREDGGFTIVDWKTGRRPGREALAHRVFQLGSYAVAYARLHNLPEDAVDGAFFYSASGETVRPKLPGSAEISRVLREALGE